MNKKKRDSKEWRKRRARDMALDMAQRRLISFGWICLLAFGVWALALSKL